MKNFLFKIILVTLIAAAGYWGWRDSRLLHDNHDLRDTIRLLETEKADLNQKLIAATTATPPGDRAAILSQIEKQTSELRGLPFKNTVTYKNIGRDELKTFLRKKLTDQYSSQEMHDYGRGLETIGLIPPGTDLMSSILGLYDEQVAAFYVPEERALYTFKGTTLERNIDKVTMAHELTHALQDQNYDLTKFPLKVKDNDDLALATSALVEGDATILMANYYGQYLDPRNMLSDMLSGVMGQKTAKFQSAPPYFRDMLLFPYQQGADFAAAVFAAGGTEGLNAAFVHPPVSTRQILHPDEYLHNRHDPKLLTVQVTPPPDWRLIGNNVLGAFGMRSLFSQFGGIFEAQRATDGWNGDHYNVFEQGTNGPCVLIWETTWDNPQAADEFVSAYKRVVQQRGMVADIQQNGAGVSICQAPSQEILTVWRPSPGK